MRTMVLSRVYTIELYAKSSAGTPSLTIACIGDQVGNATALNSATWTKCTFTFTADADDVATPNIKIWLSGAATVYIDDVKYSASAIQTCSQIQLHSLQSLRVIRYWRLC